MSTPAAKGKPDRTLLVILAAIGALVIVTVLIILSRGEPRMLDASTPEGVVQRYSAAVIVGDEEEAADYLTDDTGDVCNQIELPATDDIRIVLVSTAERSNSAEVRVSIVTFYNQGPFGDSYEEEAVFDLVQIDGEWLVDTAPWQLMICPDAANLK